jgi:hypothetical protein
VTKVAGLPMAKHILVSEFHEYSAAHRAFAELLHSGIEPGDISLIAGDRSDHQGAQRDLGIIDGDADHWCGVVRCGITLLAVRTDDTRRARVRRIIGAYAPIAIEVAAPPSVARSRA